MILLQSFIYFYIVKRYILQRYKKFIFNAGIFLQEVCVKQLLIPAYCLAFS